MSHYRSFLAIQSELEAALKRDPSFTPAWPVASSPALRQPPEPQGKVFIDAPAAATLLDFSCATYGVLLRCLAQCFGRPTGGVVDAGTVLMSAAIELMHVVGEASTALARLPASINRPGINAGMTFTMLRGVKPLPIRVEQQVLLERLAALTASRCELSDGARSALARASAHLAGLR